MLKLNIIKIFVADNEIVSLSKDYIHFNIVSDYKAKKYSKYLYFV